MPFYYNLHRHDKIFAKIYGPDVPKTKPGKDGRFKDWRTYQMFDHLPMWIELRVDFSPAYVERTAEGEEAVVPVSAPVKPQA